MSKRHAVLLLAVALLLTGLAGRAAGAQTATVARPCGLRVPLGRLHGVPAFAVPAQGRARAQRLAGGWLRCRLERSDGTSFAVAYADSRRRVLEMRFFRTTGALRVSADAAYAAASAAEAQRVSCGSAAQASIGNVYWRGSRNWWIGTGAPGISADAVVKAVKAAQSEWTNNINWCGYKDEANPPAHYMGRTNKKAGEDGQSTVDWGTLKNDQACPGALGCTVTWYDSTGKPLESDTRFNTAFKWVIGSGNGHDQYDIQSVAAHEIGHVYQFDHVTNSSHNDQTAVMWPYGYPGDTSGRKLGKGDAEENNKHY